MRVDIIKIKKFDLMDRLVEFAANVALFCTDSPIDMTRSYYSNQLLKSGSSSTLNFGEAKGTNSERDYINNSTLNFEELKESRVDLKILKRLNYGGPSKCVLLLDKVEQLNKSNSTYHKKQERITNRI